MQMPEISTKQLISYFDMLNKINHSRNIRVARLEDINKSGNMEGDDLEVLIPIYDSQEEEEQILYLISKDQVQEIVFKANLENMAKQRSPHKSSSALSRVQQIRKDLFDIDLKPKKKRAWINCKSVEPRLLMLIFIRCKVLKSLSYTKVRDYLFTTVAEDLCTRGNVVYWKKLLLHELKAKTIMQ
jgi:hypothetical protein